MMGHAQSSYPYYVRRTNDMYYICIHIKRMSQQQKVIDNTKPLLRKLKSLVDNKSGIQAHTIWIMCRYKVR